MESMKFENLAPVYQVFAWSITESGISIETHRFTNRIKAMESIKTLQPKFDNCILAENYKQIGKMWKYISELNDELTKPLKGVQNSVQPDVVESKGKEKKNAKA